MEIKYYFISYLYGSSEKNVCNNIIDHHPLNWQSYAEKSYPGQYVLMDWKEISKEEYEYFGRGV